MLTSLKTKRSSRRFPLFAAFALFALPSFAGAQDDEPIVHEFNDADLVQGHLHSSDQALIRVHGGIRHGSLIRPRLTFVPELLKSCEDSS